MMKILKAMNIILLEYPLHELSHTIIRLAIHNEDEQEVYFKEGKETEI